MTPLLIFLVGLIIMAGDPQVPQIVKTLAWAALVLIGILLGALTFLKVPGAL